MDNNKTFNQTLVDLGKCITTDTLEDLKYLCKDVVLPARMERVKRPLDLFQALEECGKISATNTQYLIELLEGEGNQKLAVKLAPFNRGIPTDHDMVQEALSSYNDVQYQQQQQTRVEFPNVPETQLNVYRQVLRQISNSLRADDLQNMCYTSEEAVRSGLRSWTNLSGKTMLNFFEGKGLISPDNLDYLKKLLFDNGRMDLHNLIEQYSRIYLGRYSKPLNPWPPPVTEQQRHYHQPPPYNPDYSAAVINHHSSLLRYSSLHQPSDSMTSSMEPQAGDSLKIPTQVVDDDDDNTTMMAGSTVHQMRNITRVFGSHKGIMDVGGYQNNRDHFEEQEPEYRRQLEQKEMELQRHQATLREKEETINQITQQYEHQLHLLRQVKAESGSEKERLQQQILEYEQMLQQNNEQIEILRRENQQGPVMIGSVGEKYSMDKTPHGIAVIINNSSFHSVVPNEDPLPDRRGSQVDEDNLRVTWEYLRYDVRILKNLTASELTRQLMQIALQNHEKYDSFVCCILSHGYLDGVYGTDSKPVKINDIASLFKGNFCPTLADKPKLFFIQACRGDDEDRGVAVQKDAKGDSNDAIRHSLPSEADFLFGYATPPGNVSWRSPRYGSWYISKLCEVFVDNAPQQDLLSMLTIVNHKVSEAYTTQGYKQCPAPVTLLRKQVWFFGHLV